MKKTKKEKIINIISVSLIICGIICFIIKCFTNEYVDSSGILHEYFFLIPIGYTLIFSGIIILLIKKIIKK